MRAPHPGPALCRRRGRWESGGREGRWPARARGFPEDGGHVSCPLSRPGLGKAGSEAVTAGRRPCPAQPRLHQDGPEAPLLPSRRRGRLSAMSDDSRPPPGRHGFLSLSPERGAADPLSRVGRPWGPRDDGVPGTPAWMPEDAGPPRQPLHGRRPQPASPTRCLRSGKAVPHAFVRTRLGFCK